MDAKTIGTFFSGAGVSAVALGSLGRYAINKAIDARLKQEEIAYTHTFNEKLARIQDELSGISKRREIQFNKLHEERAELIKRLHALLRETEDMLEGLDKADKEWATNLEGLVESGSRESAEEAFTAFFAPITEKQKLLWQFIRENEIYFGKDLLKTLAVILDSLCCMQFDRFENLLTEEERKDPRWTTAEKKLDKTKAELGEAISLLRNDFRKLLGVESHETGMPGQE